MSRNRKKGKRTYLVIWWFNQAPYVATMHEDIAAGAAANLHNGLVIAVDGDLKGIEVHDHWRRDDRGHPLPATWRSLA